ncbi:hypothetical protein [Endozoicomonas sp. GU-1]|uniref:hypothetical protein n=1 Tax=Endozoicomonas sp. GU-1 TaxID=3009078 RepID=UPI0022B4771A|nr:hypothetical protein [Endozoicomonas sp. GU-1]WBA79299.1 hypothetical protein O2T12_12985 [Endozoicomonas sp. GU-1]WBA86943.1 hypothetical protein O3276_02560 [Endozoicomonas sp. GU-1]
MHNYISLFHENIKSRLLFCSEVHFAEMSITANGWGYSSTPDAINPLLPNHPGRDAWVTGVQCWYFSECENGS